MTDDVAALLPLARRIARQYGRGPLDDEFESVAVAALGEAAIVFDPGRAGSMTFEKFARRRVHYRCRDALRQWVVRYRPDFTGGVIFRTVPFIVEGSEYEPFAPEPDEDRWAEVREVFDARRAAAGPYGRPGAPSRRTWDAVAAWLDGDDQATVARRFGVHPSRIAQMARLVADALREEMAS